MYRYVTCMGELWRMTEGQWRRWLLRRSRREEPRVPGKLITSKVEDVTDWDEEDCQSWLDEHE